MKRVRSPLESDGLALLPFPEDGHCLLVLGVSNHATRQVKRLAGQTGLAGSIDRIVPQSRPPQGNDHTQQATSPYEYMYQIMRHSVL